MKSQEGVEEIIVFKDDHLYLLDSGFDG